MMIHVTEQVARPRDEVFDAMADARNEPTWNSQVSSTELTSGEPIGEGTKFATVNRGQPYTAMIKEHARPERLVFTVVGKTMSILGTMQFTEVDNGTRLEAEFDMQPHGFMKVMFPLMGPAVRKDFPRQFASFRQFCESSSTGASSS